MSHAKNIFKKIINPVKSIREYLNEFRNTAANGRPEPEFGIDSPTPPKVPAMKSSAKNKKAKSDTDEQYETFSTDTEQNQSIQADDMLKAMGFDKLGILFKFQDNQSTF